MTEEQKFGKQLLCCVFKEIPQTTGVPHHANQWSLLLLATVLSVLSESVLQSSG